MVFLQCSFLVQKWGWGIKKRQKKSQNDKEKTKKRTKSGKIEQKAKK